MAWIGRRAAAAGTRAIVLLSHHQPFSAFENGGEHLIEKLNLLLSGKRIHAWYWGHEHRCVLFDQHPTWGLYGRCLGHSGFPSFRDKFTGEPERKLAGGTSWYRVARAGAPSGLVLDGPNQYVEGHAAKYAPNGYLTLRLDGPAIHETVCAPDGAVLFESTLSQ